MTKPKNIHFEWHPLIATPFRYNPPHPEARFRPAYGKNIFYGSTCEETALYEHAFHFMKQRLHLDIETETGSRTLFLVDANETNLFNLNHHQNCSVIMDRKDYSFSHQFIKTNPPYSFILYPSCRDPHHRNNAAVFDITTLNKIPNSEMAINFFYDNQLKKMTWINYFLHIQWGEVA